MQTAPALDGIRVLEVTQYEVGTVCGQHLAWLGADVIKIEPPKTGELGRATSLSFYSTLNSSKRGLTLDLKAERGRQIFLDLVRTADVLIENLAPGKFETLKLPYPALQDVNPRLVFARGKGFGTWGPYASYKSFDMVAQATSGAMSATGVATGPPLIERFPVADNATGVHLALGIMAALWQRMTTGEGQQVEASLQDTMLSMGRMWFSYHIAGSPQERLGNHYWAGGDLYPCAGGGPDDYIYIMCHPNRWPMWAALFTVIGRPDLVDPARLADPEIRGRDYADEIEESIRSWTVRRAKHEAMTSLAEAGVPAGAVLSAEEVMADSHLRARDMIVNVEHPTHGSLTILGSPIKLGQSPPRISAPPLDLGENNEEILQELGYSEAEINRLRDDSVI
jgi:formyl-CoA transferase